MRIGTRGSKLALWQARHVQDLLRTVTGVDAELVVIKTAGDRDQAASLSEMAGKGFFTKEIEDALLAGTIDLAVHSLKDLQTTMPPGLELCAVPARGDRRDTLLIRPEALNSMQPLRLRSGARVGTSANRRIAQINFLRPDLIVESLRGNVPTRVQKLRDGQYDAIVAAAAGLERLELPLDDLVVYRMPEMLFVPAPGQGALGLQIRADDDDTNRVVAQIDQPSVREIVYLEREIMRRLEGGCQLALGTAAEETEFGLRLAAFLGTSDPMRPRRINVCGADQETILGAVESYLRAETITRPEDAPVRVWITREPARAEAFGKACTSGLFEVSALPVFYAVAAGSPEEQKDALGRLDTYDWVFLTSQIAVARFADLLDKFGASLGRNTRVATVGRKTAAAVQARNWRVDFVGDVADARSLGESFLAASGRRIGRVLFPCGQAASGGLAVQLAGGCEAFDQLVCYDVVEHPQLPQTVASLPDPDAIVFTSPQAARFLLSHCPPDPKVTAVAIGPATSEALLAAGFPLVYEASERSLEGTAEVINGLYADPKTPPLTA
jgi:hydroxymethylbilane synthase